VVAITVNHEGLSDKAIPLVCELLTQITGLPAFDVLRDGPAGLLGALRPHLRSAPFAAVGAP
jgi:uncharacterized NAD-dependent epimerase/dehydratase family protein